MRMKRKIKKLRILGSELWAAALDGLCKIGIHLPVDVRSLDTMVEEHMCRHCEKREIVLLK